MQGDDLRNLGVIKCISVAWLAVWAWPSISSLQIIDCSRPRPILSALAGAHALQRAHRTGTAHMACSME